MKRLHTPFLTIVLMACAPETEEATNSSCGALALSVGTMEARIDREHFTWTSAAWGRRTHTVYLYSGTVYQHSVLSFHLEKTVDGRYAGPEVSMGVAPLEFALDESPSWGVFQDASSTLYFSEDGRLVIEEVDGDVVSGCFSYTAVEEGRDPVEVTEGAFRLARATESGWF